MLLEVAKQTGERSSYRAWARLLSGLMLTRRGEEAWEKRR